MEGMNIEQKSEIYPSNRGHKWSEEEESLLLEELNNELSVETIAKSHNRTLGGISSRCGEIAYKMHLKNIPMEEIIKQTKLDEESIKQVIEKKQNLKIKKIIKAENKEVKETKEAKEINKIIEVNKIIEINKIVENNDINVLKNDIIEMKNDIKDLKKIITDLVETLKLSHEWAFE
jgi:hypothetical protein